MKILTAICWLIVLDLTFIVAAKSAGYEIGVPWEGVIFVELLAIGAVASAPCSESEKD